MAGSEIDSPSTNPPDVSGAPDASAALHTVAIPKKRDAAKGGLIVGVIGAIVILVAGAFIAGSMSSAGKSIAGDLNGSPAAAAAMADFAVNDSSSKNVYQQQVNGIWTTKDLLKVVADQTANINTLGSNIQATQTALVWTQVGVMALLVALIGMVAVLGRRFLDVLLNRKAE